MLVLIGSLTACSEELPPPSCWDATSSYSCIVFDDKKFDINNVTATIYFGDSSIKPWGLPWDEGHLYAQAFFSNVPSLDIWRSIWDVTDEEEADVMQQIEEMPLESTAENIFTENVIYVVHHETADAYFSGEYQVDETYDQEAMRLKSVYFHHSQRIRIPAELFTEDQGTISFIYYTLFYLNGFSKTNGQNVDFTYTKKKGTIRLTNKIFYSNGLANRKIKVLNLDH